MPRTVAFLRAINVGGHVVKMDRLRSLFEVLGFTDVSTFIASGNVLFSTRKKNEADLVKLIEKTLQESLGYEVATFLRTDTELSKIAGTSLFTPAQTKAATTSNVIFLSAPLSAAQQRSLDSLKTPIDTFAVKGREIYWLCTKGQSASKFSNTVLEKTTGARSTIRGIATVRKIVELFDADNS